MSISSELTALQNDITNARTAITTKGGTVTSGGGSSQLAIDIATIPTGTVTGDYEVRFIDYDGTILKTQSVVSGGNATAPTVPTHSGLTFQEWNNTFTNVTRDIDVGATYIPTDNDTKIYISLDNILNIRIKFIQSASGFITINWGDGTTTTPTETTVSETHNYSTSGDYVITLVHTGTGTVTISGKSSCSDFLMPADITTSTYYSSYDISNVMSVTGKVTKLIFADYTNFTLYALAQFGQLEEIVVPKNCNLYETEGILHGAQSLKCVITPSTTTSIGANSLYVMANVTAIVLNNGITTINTSGLAEAYNCTKLVFPNSVTSILSSLENWYSVEKVVLPDNITSLPQKMFGLCGNLKAISLPSSLTSIGTSAFLGCSGLEEITLPSGVTEISGSLFSNCYGLRKLTTGSRVGQIGSSSFNNCKALKEVEGLNFNQFPQFGTYCLQYTDSLDIDITPTTSNTISTSGLRNSGIRSFDLSHTSVIGNNAFQQCSNLKSIGTFGLDITTIPQNMCYRCGYLEKVVYTSRITTISAGAFFGCAGVMLHDFRASTAIPTLSNTSAFTSNNAACKIVVPDSLYDSWIVATNWSTYSNFIIKASEYTGV